MGRAYLVPRPLSVFHLSLDTLPKRIDREGLGESRTGTRQGKGMVSRGRGGGGDSHAKVMGVIVENFEKNPLKVPEFCLLLAVQKNFYPKEVPKSVD